MLVENGRDRPNLPLDIGTLHLAAVVPDLTKLLLLAHHMMSAKNTITTSEIIMIVRACLRQNILRVSLAPS
jgi:hypothetical protein